jgi:hypothetical protein
VDNCCSSCGSYRKHYMSSAVMIGWETFHLCQHCRLDTQVTKCSRDCCIGLPSGCLECCAG